MNNCFLTKPSLSDEQAVSRMITAWRAYGGRMNPGLLRHFDGDYAAWLAYLSDRENGTDIGEEVPQTFYLLKRSDGTTLGATSLRHYLNHTNIIDGGHVAYGISPEWRKMGYGRLILRLALEKLRERGIERVLVTCDADNTASQRVIEANGGVLENQALDEDGVLVNRYWIANA